MEPEPTVLDSLRKAVDAMPDDVPLRLHLASCCGRGPAGRSHQAARRRPAARPGQRAGTEPAARAGGAREPGRRPRPRPRTPGAGRSGRGAPGVDVPGEGGPGRGPGRKRREAALRLAAGRRRAAWRRPAGAVGERHRSRNSGLRGLRASSLAVAGAFTLDGRGGWFCRGDRAAITAPCSASRCRCCGGCRWPSFGFSVTVAVGLSRRASTGLLVSRAMAHYPVISEQAESTGRMHW